MGDMIFAADPTTQTSTPELTPINIYDGTDGIDKYGHANTINCAKSYNAGFARYRRVRSTYMADNSNATTTMIYDVVPATTPLGYPTLVFALT
eukprot:6016605-Pyramimonas_sp.AAC.1